MDFRFIGGSMGSVVGEKVAKTVERAYAEELPLVIVSASGGARMFEGVYSLMQMAKTSVALSRYVEGSWPYVPVLTDPPFGGGAGAVGGAGRGAPSRSASGGRGPASRSCPTPRWAG